MGNEWRDPPKKPKRRSPMDTGNDGFWDSLGCGIVAFGVLATVVTGLVGTAVHFVS